MSNGKDNLLYYGGLAVIAYLLYKKFVPDLSPGSPTASAGGSLLQSIFSPSASNYTPGTTFIVVFPDGSSHAIDPNTIAPDGTITWTDGQQYTVMTGIAGHAAVLTSTIVSTQTPSGYVSAAEMYPSGA